MTKIDIISGFLGAGKTTFIKKMIEEVFQGEKIVLIENEFGEVGIDGGFLKDAGIEITEMNSGCICCSLVGDFGKNLHEVIGKFHPDRILIEPSGVGKLSDVMKSVIDVEKEEDVKLNGLITVVNALKAGKQMKAFGEFFNNQIAYATTIVLSRSQKASPEQLELCVKQIQALNGKAAIITTPWEEIKGEQILKVVEGQDSLEMKLIAEQHAKEEAEHHAHEHHHEHEEHEHGHEEHCCGHGEHGHVHEEHSHDHAEHGHEHSHEESCHDHEEHGESCRDHEEHGHEHSHGEGRHDHGEHEGHEHVHEEHEHHEGHEHVHGEQEHHHEHGENCTCGCHDHEHHHHHADDVFTSWGKETPHKFEREHIEDILKTFCESDDYGTILRAKGMVEDVNGSWIYFDMVPGEYELREGEPDYTGRLCVIGTDIDEHRLEELFGIA